MIYLKVGKSRLAIRGILVIFLGLIVDYLTGYLIAYAQYLQFYKLKGIELVTNEFVKKPMTAFRVLILGDESKPVWISIHDVYAHPMFHVTLVCVYLYFVFSYFTSSKKMEKKDASEYGSHGTARWASKKEIEEALLRTDKGFIVGQYKGKMAVHPLDSPLNQVISVFGGSGSAKTSGYIIPNILHIAENIGESLIITDPKGELYNKTSDFLRKQGYDVWVFNLLDMKRSMRYNPLDYVNSTEEALSLANTIISNTEGREPKGDSMWRNAEMAYFAALMMYLKETRPKREQTIKSILQLGTRIGKDEELLDMMFSQLPPDSEALEMYNIFRLAQDKTRAGILIGFGVRLKLWVSKNVAQLTSCSDFDLNQLGQKKTALFILTPDSDSTFDLLPALLIDQCIQLLYKQAGRNATGRLNVPVRGLLDELANITAINDLERKASTMRSRGISIVPIFQSITQFRNRYDNERWSEILASSDTIVFLGTSDNVTAEYFSKKLGTTTILINSISESKNARGTSEGKSHTVIGRPLMTPDELTRLPVEKAIVFQRGKNPVLLDKYFYFKQDRWKDLKEVNWYTDIPVREDDPIPIIDPFEGRMLEEMQDESDVEEKLRNDDEYKQDSYISSLLEEEEEEVKSIFNET